MEKIRKYVGKVVCGINYIGLAVCFVMVFVVAIDIILRKASGNILSIKGSNEFSQFFLVVMCMLAIPAFQVKKGHIWVNMFVDKFPARFRTFWLAVMHLLETGVSALLTYGGIMKIQTFLSTGTVTDVIHMPKWPFALVLTIGFAELTILLLIDTIQLFIDGAKGGKAVAENN